MVLEKSGRSIVSLAAAAALVVLAGCNSIDQGAAGLFGGDNRTTDAAGNELPRLSELRAFCPPVTLRSGTSAYNSYAGNAKDDPSKVVYQASIADVTRTCSYDNNNIGVTVAVAGRVVPGPMGKSGNVTMPIRVAVVQNGQTIYSKLHRHPVQVSDTAGATQFVFTDAGVVIPGPADRSIQIFAGYDEGPYNTP